MEKKVLKVVKGVLIGLFVMILGLCSVASVPTGHTGVVTTFGKVENQTLESGVHLKFPWQKVIEIDNRTQKQTISMSSFSSDIQEVEVIYTINYRIEKENAQNIYRTIGLSYFDTVIQPKVVEAVKGVTAKYTAENLVSSRSEVAMAIENQLRNDLAVYNIELVATSIENIDFTDAFTDAVEAKQVAEQNKLRAQTEAETKVIQAQADADVKLIEAQAAAEANAIITESLTEEVLREQMINKWNGQLPRVTGSSDLMLDVSSLTEAE